MRVEESAHARGSDAVERSKPDGPKAGWRVEATAIPEVLVVHLERHRDHRGFFEELWQRERYREAGIDVSFVQDNLAWSTRGVRRGLHYQDPHPQAKLITVLRGEIFDVAVDVRPESRTRGQWVGVRMAASEGRQVFVPAGFAHGYQVLSDDALVHYKASDVYHPECQHSIGLDDAGVEWVGGYEE